MRGSSNDFSHLPESPLVRILPELAPKIGCRGFTGPVPPPLWMSWIGNYLTIRQKDGQISQWTRTTVLFFWLFKKFMLFFFSGI